MGKIKLFLLFFIIFAGTTIFGNEVVKNKKPVFNTKNKYENKIKFNNFSFSKNDSKTKSENDHLKLYNNFIIVGSVFTGSAGILLATGLIMGFIPINGNGRVHQPHTLFDRNVFMTAYGSVGVSLIITASVFFLFSLPLLIYGAVKKNIYLKNNNEPKKYITLNFNSGMVSIKFDWIRRLN